MILFLSVSHGNLAKWKKINNINCNHIMYIDIKILELFCPSNWVLRLLPRLQERKKKTVVIAVNPLTEWCACLNSATSLLLFSDVDHVWSKLLELKWFSNKISALSQTGDKRWTRLLSNIYHIWIHYLWRDFTVVDLVIKRRRGSERRGDNDSLSQSSWNNNCSGKKCWQVMNQRGLKP